MRGLKIRVIILVFAAVLLVGVGGRYIHYQKRVVDPMAAAASSLPGVASLEVVETPEGGTNVLVELGPEVQLEKVYPQLQAIVTSSLGANFNQLILIDNRSAWRSGCRRWRTRGPSWSSTTAVWSCCSTTPHCGRTNRSRRSVPRSPPWSRGARSWRRRCACGCGNAGRRSVRCVTPTEAAPPGFACPSACDGPAQGLPGPCPGPSNLVDQVSADVFSVFGRVDAG